MTGAAVVLWVASVLVAIVVGVLVGRRLARRAAPTGRAFNPVTRHRGPRRTPEICEQVVDVSQNAVIVVDRDEFVVLANPSARRLGVIDGDRVAQPELRELARAMFGTLRPAPRQVTVENRGGRGDLQAFAVFASAIQLDGEPRPSSVVLLLNDVTDLRRLEAVRRDFVANVSHELKTPVGALTLLAEAVQDAADDPEAVARFAQRMQREGHRLGRLVRELIELSRLQGADPLPGSDLVLVSDVLEDAVDAHRLAAEQAGINVVVRCPVDLAVRGNAAQLTMAVSNLLDNALAYSPAQTRVAVTAAADPAGGDDGDQPVVRVAVSDQGIGIAETDQERVFERFYRVDPARSRATGGTGLGLAIVKHVATNHGGAVSVWSREGSGSTFTISLPAAALPPTGPTPDADAAERRDPQEDDVDVQPTRTVAGRP